MAMGIGPIEAHKEPFERQLLVQNPWLATETPESPKVEGREVETPENELRDEE